MHAGVSDGECVIGRQRGTRVATAKVDGARVSVGDIAGQVACRDGDIKRRSAPVFAGAEMMKWVAAAAAVEMVPLVPVSEPLTVSVAVTVWLPAVLR